MTYNLFYIVRGWYELGQSECNKCLIYYLYKTKRYTHQANRMIRVFITAMLILLSCPALADKHQVDSLYYIDSQTGRTPVFDKAENTPMVNVTDATCLADNGDRVRKEEVANLFWTKVTILEGTCKDKLGYVSPSNIRRWFFSSGK